MSNLISLETPVKDSSVEFNPTPPVKPRSAVESIKQGFIDSKPIKLGKILGPSCACVIAYIPNYVLMSYSTNLTNVVSTSIVGFISVFAVQHLWRLFEEHNKKKLEAENKFIKETLGLKTPEEKANVAVPALNFSLYKTRNLTVSNYMKEFIDKASFRDLESNLSFVADNPYQISEQLEHPFLSNDFSQEEDLEKTVHIQQLVDEIAHFLTNNYKDHIHNQKKDHLEDLKSYSFVFKALALGAKVYKSFKKVIEDLNISADQIASMVSHSTALLKDGIEIFTIGFECCLIDARKKEINDLVHDIKTLETTIQSINQKKEYSSDKKSLLIHAIKISKANLIARKAALEERNKKKFESIAWSILDACLGGTQDLLEFIRDNTNLLANFPDYANYLLETTDSIMIVGSLVSFFACCRKIYSADDKIAKSKFKEDFCKKELEHHRQKKSTASDYGDEESTYFLFLQIKYKTLHEGRFHYFLSQLEKTIKLGDSILTVANSSHLIVLGLLGITLSPAAVGFLSTGATIFTVCSLGVGASHLLKSFYLKRHTLYFCLQVVLVYCQRRQIFNRFVHLNELASRKKYEMDCLTEESKTLLNDYNCRDNPAYLLPEQRIRYQQIIEKIEFLDKTTRELEKKVEEVWKEHVFLDKKLKTKEERIPFLEMADKLSGINYKQLMHLRDRIAEELTTDEGKAIWAKQLRDLGFHSLKELSANQILKYAVSKKLPIALEKSQQLGV